MFDSLKRRLRNLLLSAPGKSKTQGGKGVHAELFGTFFKKRIRQFAGRKNGFQGISKRFPPLVEGGFHQEEKSAFRFHGGRLFALRKPDNGAFHARWRTESLFIYLKQILNIKKRLQKHTRDA